MDHIDQMEDSSKGSPVSALTGVGEVLRAKLEEAGIHSIEELSDRSLDELKEIPGVGEKTAEKLRHAALEYLTDSDETERSDQADSSSGGRG
jgi:transcription termination factor NusA